MFSAELLKGMLFYLSKVDESEKYQEYVFLQNLDKCSTDPLVFAFGI